jgi:hypothetical protein
MFCKDDSLTYLNHLGYNVISLPRENIEPLLVIGGKKKKLEVLGPLSHFVLGASYVPTVKYDQTASKITSKKTNKLDSRLGIELMNKYLSALDATSGKLNVGYEKAVEIEIVFENVLYDSVYITDIDDYLSSATPKTKTLLMECINEEGEAHIITETIKSNSFGVIAYDKDKHELNLDIKGIQSLLGGGSGINVSKDENLKVSYQGDKFLKFGFKAASFWMQEDNNGEAQFRLKMDKGTLVMKGKAPVEGKQSHDVLFAQHELLDVDFI